MKAIYLAVMLLFALPSVAAAQHGESTCAGPQPSQTASSDKVVLNICNEAGGMAAIPRLRLYFRLYESGRIEYEINRGYDPRAGEANFRLVLKVARARAVDVAEIIALGQQPDFQKAQAEYPIFRRWTDSSLKTTIVFTAQGREKKIVVNNYSADDKEHEGRYPSALRKLLRKVEELRPTNR